MSHLTEKCIKKPPPQIPVPLQVARDALFHTQSSYCSGHSTPWFTYCPTPSNFLISPPGAKISGRNTA